jgi:mono/diheme cytochrome c family protein
LIKRNSARALLVAALLLAGAAAPHGAGAQAPSDADGASPPPGVENARRAWQNWTLNCQGCHRPDGTGSEGTAPSLAGTVAKFLWVPGGREYLIRVPGVATSPLSSEDLAEVVNWMLWRFDREHVPAGFQPFTAAEIARGRTQPLRLEASQMRGDLLAKAESSGPPGGPQAKDSRPP